MNDDKRPITVKAPYLEEFSGGVKLCAPVDWQNEKRTLWVEVEKKYSEYLTNDRADAWVVALLTTAMREGRDIVCEVPVTRRLLYQLNHYLVPMMANNMDVFHPITVHAQPIEEKLSCAGAVGTGWTGGVDSMFTYMKSTEKELPMLTHLLITSNGALEEADNSATLKQLVERTEKGFAREAGLDVIGVDTNLQDVFSEPFLSVASFRHGAVVLALQKLFRYFLCSAAYEFSRFAFDADNAFYYDLASLSCFETDTTIFYAAGGAYSRVQKLQALSSFPLAYRYLHPCIHVTGGNCGRCGKCVRTEAVLYGLGTLERFSKVFDLEAFGRDKDWYIAQVLANERSQHYGEALVLFRQRGIEPSTEARRMARSLRAAKAVAERNKEFLMEKLPVPEANRRENIRSLEGNE